MISKEREERIIRQVMEKLSKKEKIRVRRKKIFGYDNKDHIDDDNLRALGNGIMKMVSLTTTIVRVVIHCRVKAVSVRLVNTNEVKMHYKVIEARAVGRTERSYAKRIKKKEIRILESV